MLSRYHNSFSTMLCNYLVYLPVYSKIKMFISLLNFGRVYGRYLVPRLSYFQLTIHRIMLRLTGKTEP